MSHCKLRRGLNGEACTVSWVYRPRGHCRDYHAGGLSLSYVQADHFKTGLSVDVYQQVPDVQVSYDEGWDVSWTVR